MGRFLPNEIAQAYGYLRGARVNRSFLLLSVFLSVSSALVNLYLVRMLFPLFHGIISRDFSPVLQDAVLGRVAALFPGVFAQATGLFILLVSWVYVLSLVKSALNYVLSIVVRREALLVARQTRLMIFDRYLSFGKLFFDRNNTSSLVWQATHCQNWISGLFVAFQSLMSALLELAVYLSIMTLVSWRLTVSVLLALPLFSLSRFVVGRIRDYSKAHANALSGLHAGLTQTLALLTLVRTSGKAEHERRRFGRLAAEEVGAALRVHRMTSLMPPVLEMTGTTALLLSSLCLSLFVANGALAAANVFVFFFLVLRTVPLLIDLARFRTTIAEQTASARAFDALMDDGDKHILRSGSQEFRGTFQRIEIRNLDFAYVPGSPVLRNLSFSIPQGGMIGLIGPTGAGKTTLAHLLFRFYDCPPGTIFIDGVDIREFDVESLRRQMALVSQEAAVLEDTVRANILYSVNRPLRPGDLERVIEKAALTDFVARLPQGLDTVVGERGARLSGGERQRISIARAFLKEANLLVLDEPTSALDPESERLIAQATYELTRGRTTIVIAHRMSTIRNADLVAVLKDGAIVQQGPPDRLAQEPGPFQNYLRASNPSSKSTAA